MMEDVYLVRTEGDTLDIYVFGVLGVDPPLSMTMYGWCKGTDLIIMGW
jgi:hypothetical protein